MATFAIKGHATRGNEVIELLEMLGGINIHNLNGNQNYAYYIIDSDKEIKGGLYVFGDEELLRPTLEEFLEKFPYKVGDKVQHKGATSCGSVFEIKKMQWVNNDVEYTIKRLYYNNDYTTCTAKDLQPYKKETMEDKGTLVQIDLTKELCVADEVEVILGDYEFILKDGKTYFIKKKPQYPKTYEECHKLMVQWKEYDCNPNSELILCEAPIHDFCKLIVARNIYWKIAGEQMGLGKPWKPDWEKADERKYCIVNTEGNVAKWVEKTTNKVLAFPTEEMRDAFYENFKDLIELCKELL